MLATFVGSKPKKAESTLLSSARKVRPDKEVYLSH
jgi:hypothetical protein